MAEKVPVLGSYLTPALLVGVAACLGLTYAVAWRVVNTPKLADLLIDTEAEMKKVTPALEQKVGQKTTRRPPHPPLRAAAALHCVQCGTKGDVASVCIGKTSREAKPR